MKRYDSFSMESAGQYGYMKTDRGTNRCNYPVLYYFVSGIERKLCEIEDRVTANYSASICPLCLSAELCNTCPRWLLLFITVSFGKGGVTLCTTDASTGIPDSIALPAVPNYRMPKDRAANYSTIAVFTCVNTCEPGRRCNGPTNIHITCT